MDRCGWTWWSLRSFPIWPILSFYELCLTIHNHLCPIAHSPAMLKPCSYPFPQPSHQAKHQKDSHSVPTAVTALYSRAAFWHKAEMGLLITCHGETQPKKKIAFSTTAFVHSGLILDSCMSVIKCCCFLYATALCLSWEESPLNIYLNNNIPRAL